MEGALGWALPLARFVHDAALTLLFGGLLFPVYCLPRGGRTIPPRLLGALRIKAWIAATSALAVFALSVGGMAGSLAAAADPALLIDTALGSDFGWLFLAREAVLVVCATVLMRRAQGAPPLWLSGAALAALAMTGHAREGAGWFVALHVGLDALHLLSAGLWIGALPWFAVLLAPARSAALAMPAVRRFSTVASVAVALLILSGVGATLLLVVSPLALPQTVWGRLLILKVVLAGAMVALAAHNRWRSSPAIERGDRSAAAVLRRNARAELGLALGVIAIVGWLGTLPFDGQG